MVLESTLKTSEREKEVTENMIKDLQVDKFRPTTMGGLGMHSTKQKAQSMLIRCFLETAVFNHHVLQDSTWPEPDNPPYFREEIFSIIRNAPLHSSNDVTTMTSSQWYHTY